MADIDLRVFDEPPAGLFETSSRDLNALLGGPSLVRIAGEREPPLFISTLLHGNETSGWSALCELMATGTPPGRTILLFVGNPAAAAENVRHLSDQQDFNRIWNPPDPLAAAVLDTLSNQALFAAVDIHNNTGRNPHYSVVTEISPSALALAYTFSDHAMYVETPDTVIIRPLASMCPSITVEVGPVGYAESDIRTLDLMTRLTELDALPDASSGTPRVYRSVARVFVNEEATFDFADDPDLHLATDDLILTAGMEAVNFHSVPAGAEFGFTRQPLNHSLTVRNDAGEDVTGLYLQETHGDISLLQDVIPAMYTTDPEVIRQDCLCYFIEET